MSDQPDDERADEPDPHDEPDPALSPFADDLVWGVEPGPTDRRTKRIALAGVAIVVVLVVATILLVRLVDTGQPPPSAPSAAAARWLADLVAGTTHDRPADCAGPGRTDYLLAVRGDHPSVHVQHEQHTADRRWTVRLTLTPPKQLVNVYVQRHGTTYLIC